MESLRIVGRKGEGVVGPEIGMVIEDGLEDVLLLSLVLLLLLLTDSAWMVLSDDGGYLFVDCQSFQLAILSWM